MTPISRARLVFIVLALCAVLTIAPLASAQTEPLPMPVTGENRSPLFSRFGSVDEAESATRTPVGVTLATLDGVGDLITVTEGGAPVQFTMRLNTQPAGTVNLRYEGLQDLIVQPRRVTFTPENWDTPQNISVYGIMDYGQGDYSTFISSSRYQAEIIIDGVYDFASLNMNTLRVRVTDSPRTPPTGPLVVTTLADSITDEIPGSLRQAILAANARPEVETITFDPALTGTIPLVADLPLLPDNRDFSIRGSGQSRITIDGAGVHDGFIGGGGAGNPKVTIRDLTLSNFKQAIDVYTTLSLLDVTVRNSGEGADYRFAFPAVIARNATIARVTMEGNSGVLGGALAVTGNVDMSIRDSTFINNTAHGLNTPTDLRRFGGGAIHIDESNRVNITRSTFVGNSGALAGAIGDNRFVTPGVFISNSTFSANTASTPDGAAAINFINGGAMVYFSTFSGHNTGAGSGGVIKGSNVGLEASVIANNSAPNPVECVGINGGGFLNFSADPNCNSIYPKGIPTGVDPVLRDNGGLTMTHALLPGSNVIDSDQRLPNEGNITYCESQLGVLFGATDQRGVARPQFGACDFGAFESNLLTLPPVNRSVNGSFEAAGATFNDADGWTGRNLNPDDYRRCDSALTPVAVQNGACAFMFRGPNANTEPRRLTQTLEGGGWSRAGKVLRLSAQVRTKNLGAGGRLAINVVYRDGTTGTALVRIPAGTNPYQRVMVRLPLAKRADSVTITVRLKTGGNQNTRLWVDNVILVSQ